MHQRLLKLKCALDAPVDTSDKNKLIPDGPDSMMSSLMITDRC